MKKHPRIKFFIAGEGPQREHLEQLIAENDLKERVILTGHLEEPAQLLAALDIFVLTSEGFEGVPQSLIQALMMNVPCVAFNVGAVSDLWTRHNFALVEANQLGPMQAVLDEWMTHPGELKNKTQDQKVRLSIKDRFSKQMMLDQTWKVYERILERDLLRVES